MPCLQYVQLHDGVQIHTFLKIENQKMIFDTAIYIETAPPVS